jgi:undecaprenyl phosphate-alpha-L-ara4N flippase subunit ArnF
MTQVLFGFLFALITALVVIAGDIILKIAADGARPMLSWLVAGGAAIYALSALFWFLAMRQVTLAQAGVAYSMLTLLALCAIGVLWFGERLYLREYIGIACALAAMVLLVRVA